MKKKLMKTSKTCESEVEETPKRYSKEEMTSALTLVSIMAETGDRIEGPDRDLNHSAQDVSNKNKAFDDDNEMSSMDTISSAETPNVLKRKSNESTGKASATGSPPTISVPQPPSALINCNPYPIGTSGFVYGYYPTDSFAYSQYYPMQSFGSTTPSMYPNMGQMAPQMSQMYQNFGHMSAMPANVAPNLTPSSRQCPYCLAPNASIPVQSPYPSATGAQPHSHLIQSQNPMVFMNQQNTSKLTATSTGAAQASDSMQNL